MIWLDFEGVPTGKGHTFILFKGDFFSCEKNVLS